MTVFIPAAAYSNSGISHPAPPAGRPFGEWRRTISDQCDEIVSCLTDVLSSLESHPRHTREVARKTATELSVYCG
ncbi:MAG: hypothetical protein KDA96_00180 [Planctomycetaceae bacterium]|nr:hypothetical protein [Planctomycetaceae bacterium]